MKGNKILSVIWLLIAIVLSAVLVGSLKKGKLFVFEKLNLPEIKFSSSTKLLELQSFNMEDIDDFDIDLKSESLIIEESHNHNINIELYCSESAKPKVYVSGRILKIEGKKNHGWIGANKVVVQVPFGFNKFNYKVNSLSGSVKVDRINASDVNCNVVSGSVKFNECFSKEMSIVSTSGSVRVNGDVDKLNIKCKSGSVYVTGEFDNINLDSQSGSIDVVLSSPLLNDSSILTKSGSVELRIPSESNLAIDYNCVSGKYFNNLTEKTGKSGVDFIGSENHPKMSIVTYSGNIKVGKFRELLD